jgi:type 1 glutamine amidotransferase
MRRKPRASKHFLWVVFGGAIALASSAGMAVEEIPKHRQKQIREAAPEKPRVAPKEPRKVLVWNTPDHLYPKDPHKGYCVPYGSYAFQTLGKKTGAFEPVVSGDLAMYLPENLGQFDAIVLNNACGPWMTPTEADLQRDVFRRHGKDAAAVEQVLHKSLLDYASGGGGIVAIHFAIGANRQWPEFHEMLGATFTGHPWNEEVGVVVEEPDHPLVAAYGGKVFRLADEIYQFGEPYSRDKVRVLLSLDTATTNMGVKWIRRDDNDFALAWVKSYGKGRVFYTSFGHRTELFWDPALLQFYLDAIQFATGDLEAPTAPRRDRPVRWAPGPTPPEVRQAKMEAKAVRAPSQEELRQIEAAAPDTAPAKPRKSRKVLVWGHSWTHTPNAFAEKAIEILAAKTGAFEAVLSDDPRLLLGDRLPQFDALVMNNIHQRDPFLPEDFARRTKAGQEAARKFDQAVKESILQFVASGKGVVGIHAATAALQNWPEYGEMIGGYYAGHIAEDVPIKLDEPLHPVNACFEGRPWEIHDEIYTFREPYSRRKLRVLLSLDLSRMKDPEKRPDGDYAVSWVRQYGKGRVFYTTLGHFEATYWNPLFLRHLLAGIQFALGDLPAEATPSAE